jgi:hypothetical protein
MYHCHVFEASEFTSAIMFRVGFGYMYPALKVKYLYECTALLEMFLAHHLRYMLNDKGNCRMSWKGLPKKAYN